MYTESINSVFALFRCFRVIIYDLLIVGLIDLFYQSDAYMALPGGFGEQGKSAFISGGQRKKVTF